MKNQPVPTQDDHPPPGDGPAGRVRPRILLAVGEPALGEAAGRILAECYEVEAVVEGGAAPGAAGRPPPDLVIAGGDAARLDGLLSGLRSDPRTVAVPVIVIAERAGGGSPVVGIDPRADDFLIEPVCPSELMARVRLRLAIAGRRGQAEEAARRGERHFERFMEHLPGLAWIKDLRGRYVYANGAAREAFGTPRDLLYGRTDDEVFPPETAAQFRENDRRALAGGSGLRTIETLEHPDGLVHHSIVSKFPIPGPDGQDALVGGMAIDITELKRTEDALRQTREQLMLLVEASGGLGAAPEMAAVVGAVLALSRRLVAADAYAVWRHQPATDRWALVLASGLSEDYPRSVVEVLDRAPRRLAAPLVAEDIRAVSALGPRRDVYEREGIRSMLVMPMVVRGVPNGTLVFYYRSPHRFTEVEMHIATALANLAASALGSAELYDELKAADRRKDEFLAMLAHELRNPLAGISNAAALIGFAGPLPESIAWGMDVIGRQVRHLVRLIDDLLDVSRITRGKIPLRRAMIDAYPVLAGAVESVRPTIAARGHQLSLSFHPGLMLDADATRLEQIVVNLLTNAAKYTETGGRIWLSARREGAEIVIRVRDTGIGIPPEKIAGMFELFAQGDRSFARAEGGLGIGLTLVQRLTELHGGTVQAHSQGPGTGSEFIVRLPTASPRAEGRPAAAAEPGAAQGAVSRVLVVDDNQDTAQGMARLLELFGHDVQVAHDGPSAIARALEWRPQFVLLDIGLPGMDGYEVAARLRSRAEIRDTVLIAISGYGQDEDRRRSQEVGFDDHLVKPINHDALLRILAR
jgi:PAS domain S-box-containing protein